MARTREEAERIAKDAPGRVLVADDEASVRDLLIRVLADAGHDVAAVETGEAALLKLARERFDVLVVDKNLPGMDGLDVMRLVRSHHPHLRAVMITGYLTPASEQLAGAMGVHSFVVKPFGIVTILAAVDEAIRNGRAALSAAAAAAPRPARPRRGRSRRQPR